MDAQWFADRTLLRTLLRTQPTWTVQDFAAATHRSVGWVKKWRTRLHSADPADDAVLRSRSRARKSPPPPLDPFVSDRILAIRDQPPENLQRIPGPKAILYYLERDEQLQAAGVRLPRSTRTVWQILRLAGRIASPAQRANRTRIERPPPMASWQLDFKDVSTVPSDPDGKQHVVEVLDTVDAGTSILVNAQVREDFTAATTIPAIVETFRIDGLPDSITVDRDPCFVGGAHGSDFPAPFVRLLQCLGIQVSICPPQRPDRNAFVMVGL